MKAFAVIGANFGDEGKGITTAKLAFDNPRSIVVRSTSGSQASHSVELLRKRHSFRHVGSGTCMGSPTYLAKEFIVNPIIFMKEVSSLTCRVDVFAHSDCRLSTPFDMILNQEIENSRGSGRHGSCGLGINETVIRCLTDFKTTISDINGKLRSRLVELREEYFIPRFLSLGLEIPEYMMSETLIDNFSSDCVQFVYSTKFRPHSFLKEYDTVIFEGNQGLLLDENHRFFPHVTRSCTGTKNVVKILKEIGESSLETFYCTRPYLTRHGAGPLPRDYGTTPIYSKIEDKTNIPNPFQGTLRFAPIDLDLLKESIFNDLSESDFNTPSISISCIDQLDDVCEFVYRGEYQTCSKSELIGKIQSLLLFKQTMLHTSPDVKTSRILEKP